MVGLMEPTGLRTVLMSRDQTANDEEVRRPGMLQPAWANFHHA